MVCSLCQTRRHCFRPESETKQRCWLLGLLQPFRKFLSPSDEYTEADRTKGGFLYTVNVSVGTPPQPVMAVLDTGSPFLVISNPESKFCQQPGEPCSTFRSYDPSKSTSAVWVSDDLEITYELSTDSGSWYNDTVTIGDLTVSVFPVGTANGSSTADPQNWFGINGPGKQGPDPDTSSLQIMAQAGVLESASVGIFSGPLDASVGQVVFGGLDTSKWQGNMQILPIVDNPDNQIQVTLTSFTLSDGNTTSSDLPDDVIVANFTVDVMIDTGNFDIKLPQDMVDNIWAQVDGVQAYNLTVGDSTIPLGVCDCSLAQKSQAITFGFQGISINVPIADLVTLPPAQILQNLGVSDFPQGICVFLINGWGPAPPAYHPYILGDAFLRNAYFVLDWDTNEVGLGQANNAGDSPNIVPIAAGTSGLRDAIAGTSNSTGESPSQPSGTAAPTADPTSYAVSLSSRGNEVLIVGVLTFVLGFCI